MDKPLEDMDREALLAEVQRLRWMIEANPQVPWEADGDGNITDFSQRWLDLTGLTHEEALGGGWMQVPHPDDRPAMVAAWTHSVKTGDPYDVEHRIKLADGRYRWSRSHAIARRNEEGKVVAWYATTEDIHERRTATELLAQTSDSAPAFIAYISPDLIYQFCNHRYEEVFGLPRSQMVGKHVREVVGTEAFLILLPHFERALAGERVVHQRWVPLPTGRMFIRATYVPSFGPNGEVIGINALVTDETAAQNARDELQEARSRLEGVLASADVGTWMIDTARDLVFADRNITKMFGFEPSPEGRPTSDYLAHIHPEDLPGVAESLTKALTEGTPLDVECRIVANGQERWVTSRGTPERDTEGKITRLPGVVVDVTRQKTSEAELRKSEAELERRVAERTAELRVAHRNQEAWNYSVSHDLRAPLRAIVATSGMLREDFGDVLPTEARALLERQAAAATKLGNLIDELLRTARLASHSMAVEPLDMTEIAREAIEDQLSQTSKRFEIHVQPRMDGVGDPKLVKLVYTNFLENAMKYSPADTLIEVGQTDEGFFVRDHGIGFDMQYVQKLWGPFERLVSDLDYAGTGIGLYNVANMVERMGGRVWAESEPGQGATFWFTLG